LPTPVVPRIVGTGWDAVKLNLNTTALRNYSGLYYILEVEPVRNLPQTNVNVDTIFPYIAKYHLVSLPKRSIIGEHGMAII
jgi:recombinational DNA repair protein RecR